ncbi:hypothetical protein LCGC14_0902230 [marine sediment metagenome]|uniref:NAD-dependent epimerase/dehydratase domain-containing protein n=1 Tax=marine sediment metagenome TaxID=412755 RepID=A0A0F9S2Y0_9ZZZZ
MNFWTDRKVLLTGGEGFLGSYVKEKLEEKGCQVWVPSHKYYDLTQQNTVIGIFDKYPRFNLVIHLAAEVGGIGYNKKNPGSLLYRNLIMNSLVLHYAMMSGVSKFVSIGSICAYPKHTPVPFKEEDLFNGYPEETNAPYGIAKRALLVQGQAYRKQYGFNSIYLMPVNMYGPGDNFDPKSSHVIPALIKKFIEARESGAPEVEVWGTGKATREFLYVEDCARGIILATEDYNEEEPINIGIGSEVSIESLVTEIAMQTKYTGEIKWDNTEPDGQPRRCLDVSQAWLKFGFVAGVSLREGLERTIKWYEENRTS